VALSLFNFPTDDKPMRLVLLPLLCDSNSTLFYRTFLQRLQLPWLADAKKCNRRAGGVEWRTVNCIAPTDRNYRMRPNGYWCTCKTVFCDSVWFTKNESGLIRSLNSILADDIAVKRIFAVDNQAHARFNATLRSYEYHIHFKKDPFKKGYSWELRDRPDTALMNEAALLLMEYTDFSCFSKSRTQVKTNNCKIMSAAWEELEQGIVFKISADRFLRNMVRAIVGTLLMVGRKEIKPGDIRQIIEGKNRGDAGTSVPACGLYLTEVKYPEITGV
jgi:tRNA pseudouridine38-40 synthase